MYAALRQFKAKAGKADELAQKVKGAVPIISGVPGFMGYYVVYAPDDTVTAISLFNTVEGANESNRRALAWIEKNLAAYVMGPASATAGPVIVHSVP
jgi:Antibiotic biosynthesis monooxygenase